MARQDKQRIKQVFAFKAPGARSVLLAGDFTDWQRNAIAMQSQPSGVWLASVSLPSGSYHYRFIADGEWKDDPECTIRVPNPFGSQNSVVLVTRSPRQASSTAAKATQRA